MLMLKVADFLCQDCGTRVFVQGAVDLPDEGVSLYGQCPECNGNLTVSLESIKAQFLNAGKGN